MAKKNWLTLASKKLGRTEDLVLAEKLAYIEEGARNARKEGARKGLETRRLRAKMRVQAQRDGAWADEFQARRGYDPIGFRKLIDAGKLMVKRRTASGEGMGGLGPFVPRAWQRKIMAEFEQHRREARSRWLEIDVKTRQLGFSSMWSGVIYTDAESNPGIECAVTAHRDDTLIALNQNYRTFVGRDEAKKNKRVKRLADKLIETPRGSLIHFPTSTDSLGRGGSLTHVHVSEADYIDNLEGAMDSVLASMVKAPWASGVFESTIRRGSSSGFKSFIENRLAEQERLKAGGGVGIDWLDRNFRVRFISWIEDETAFVTLTAAERAKFAAFIGSAANPFREYQQELRDKVKLSLEQIAWWHKMCGSDARGDMGKMREMYPTTWEEAMSMIRGASFFRGEVLNWMETTCRTPTKRYRATFDGIAPMAEWGQNSLDVWDEPIPGHKYVIGVDCRNSAAAGDGSALNYAVVLDTESGLQVAEYAGLMGANEFAIAVWRAAQYYNDALVVAETGGDGGAFDDYLRNVLTYWNVYERQSFGKTVETLTGTYGFNPTSQAKTVLLGRLQDNVNEWRVEIRSFRLLEHLKSLNKHGGENYAGGTTRKRQRDEADDGAIALGLCFFGHRMALGKWQDKRFHPDAKGPNTAPLVQAYSDDWLGEYMRETEVAGNWAGIA